MAKFGVPKDDGTGWTEWICPPPSYKIACCDCGLVHTFEFRVERVKRDLGDGRFELEMMSDSKAWVAFRAKRNKRSTAAKRREDRKKECDT